MLDKPLSFLKEKEQTETNVFHLPGSMRENHWLSLMATCVRQFGLYPLWTLGNLRGVVSSKRLLLYAEMRNDNVANNGETFTCLQSENYLQHGLSVI